MLTPIGGKNLEVPDYESVQLPEQQQVFTASEAVDPLQDSQPSAQLELQSHASQSQLPESQSEQSHVSQSQSLQHKQSTQSQSGPQSSQQGQAQQLSLEGDGVVLLEAAPA